MKNKISLAEFGLPDVYKTSVGFDRFLDKFNDMSVTRDMTSTYPPYNIIKVDEHRYNIEIALAGFSKDNITVELDGANLTVRGEINQEETKDYYHKGIATRSFVRKFALADHVQIMDAKMIDGILTIELEVVVPEELRPRQIPIK